MSANLILPNRQKLLNRYFKKADVFFSVCTHRDFNIDGMTAAMELYQQSRHNYTWAPVKGDALIDRARSRAASYFLSRKEDVLFFCDDDIGFEVDDVNKIVDNVMGGADICAGMYVQKDPKGARNCLFFDGQEVTFSKGEKPVEVEAVNTGFMAVHRKVFEKMAAENVVPLCWLGDQTFYPFFQPFPALKGEKWVYLSEDWAFCDRARKLGFKIWLDPSVFLTHEGSYRYDLGDLLRAPKPGRAEFKLGASVTLK